MACEITNICRCKTLWPWQSLAAVSAEKLCIKLWALHRKGWTQMNANTNANTKEEQLSFFPFYWSGGQAVWSLPFTRPHVAAVSIIPALPFQISMSDLLMQEHKHSRNLRSVSTEQTLICMNAYGYTFLSSPPNTKVGFWNSPPGSSASLSPKKCTSIAWT